MRGKAITDVEMAKSFGVEPVDFMEQHQRTKRPALTSPTVPPDRWNSKKSKPTAAASPTPLQEGAQTPTQATTNTEPASHQHLDVDFVTHANERDMVDPHQPQSPK